MKYLALKKTAVAAASASWLLGALAGIGCAAGATTYNFTDLGTLGGGSSFAYGINSSGEVVGEAETASGATHAFTYTTTGGMVDLGTLGGNYSQAYGINSSEEVVGQAATASGALHAFTYTTTGGMVDIGTLGGNHSYAYGINSSGEVVGEADTASTFHAFTYTTTGGMVDLGTLGANYSVANGINDAGVVVGYSGNYAFVYSNGTLTNLNTVTANLPVGFSLTSANAINLSGDIVVYGTNAAGQVQAFLLTPIATPEPTSLALLAVGGLALLIRRRRSA